MSQFLSYFLTLNLILDNFVNQLDEEERENKTPHMAATTLHYLEQIFPGRVICRGSWPPRSDLALTEFFLFGLLKNNIFRNRPYI